MNRNADFRIIPSIPNENPVFTVPAWERLVHRNLLLPDVTSITVYNERFQAGLIGLAERMVGRKLIPSSKPESLLEIHGGLFSRCHKEAGVFRSVHVVAGKSMPADAPRIPEELRLRQAQVALLLGGQSIDEVLVAAAFGHVRAKAIQPFLDGNKRSSRVEASFLIATKVQRFPSWGSQPEYADAMARAHYGELTRLVNILR